MAAISFSAPLATPPDLQLDSISPPRLFGWSLIIGCSFQSRDKSVSLTVFVAKSLAAAFAPVLDESGSRYHIETRRSSVTIKPFKLLQGKAGLELLTKV